MEQSERKIWEVSEVTGMIRDLLDQTFFPLWVTGEIGNLTIHRSGHVYMTVKDQFSQMKAVFFSGAAQCRALSLKQGAKVEIFGKLSLYQTGGEFQLNVRSIRLCCVGTLQEQFEALKKKLAAEGLFDAGRKRKIPFFCRKIGLITSPGGAAVRDFIQVAQRRFRGLDIKICPAQVQGKGAEKQLAAAIRFFNRHHSDADVIVLTRGGGSLEDLWAFNEEELAYAIAGSKIPVVSAVGHEVDFTIADFAADLRAATPSAAAEMIVPETEIIQNDILQFSHRVKNAIRSVSAHAQQRLERYSMKNLILRLEHRSRDRQQQLDFLCQRTLDLLDQTRTGYTDRIRLAENTVAFCSPENTVKRGYAILSDPETGEFITTAAAAGKKQFLRAALSDGSVDLNVLQNQTTGQ